jgi:hypothetical protein
LEVNAHTTFSWHIVAGSPIDGRFGVAAATCAEGIGPAVIDGQQRIIIVSDDGSRKDGRAAHFLLLDSGQLQIAP